MKLEKTLFPLLFSCAALVVRATPTVSDVSMFPDSASGAVTISYRLLDAPAIVTLDIQTNGPSGWASIGGEHIDCFSSDSDVWKKVSGDGVYAIKWHPGQSWPGGKAVEVKAVVSAWSPDNPPDYMVADLSSSAAANTERYYPSVEFLPGGLLANPAYRTTKLVMRKIMAAGRQWTMGTGSSGAQASHAVTLADNYYIGVFEMTQAQWYQVAGYKNFQFTTEGAMRPANCVCYNEIRCASGNTKTWAGGNWPDPPYAGSFLDKLRSRTGLDIDLPGEAQWEYACRAGHAANEWGTGVTIGNSDNDPNMPGRHKNNGGYRAGESADPPSTIGPTNATAIVGSYAPNSWGLYDMHGNVFELCLDWYEDNILSLDGAVNIDQSAPAKTLAGQVAGTTRVRRGGSYHVGTGSSKPTNRLGAPPDGRAQQWGFRLACPAGNAATHAAASSGENDVPVAISSGSLSTATPALALDARSCSVAESDASELDTFPPEGMCLIFR